MQRRHHDCRTSTAALSTAWCFEAGHVPWTNATEGQALWQPGGDEEDSCLREGNRHLHLAYDDEEEELKEGEMAKDYFTVINMTKNAPHMTEPGQWPAGRAVTATLLNWNTQKKMKNNKHTILMGASILTSLSWLWTHYAQVLMLLMWINIKSSWFFLKLKLFLGKLLT